MNDKEEEKLNECLRFSKMLVDVRNAFQVAAEAIDNYLHELDEKFQVEWDPERVQWQAFEGPSGPYERAGKQEGQDYKLLIQDLKDHDGRLMKDGYFLWLFQDGATIGRKPSKK